MFNPNNLELLNILIIDDDLVVLESLKKVFTKLNAKVSIAQDGVKALSILKSGDRNFDVVISDVNMPNLDGLSLIEITRGFNQEINFIFISAFTKPEYLLKAINNGVLNYFQKPVDLFSLVSCVQGIAETKYHQNIVLLKEKESEEYFNILNQIAIISRTDTHGIITDVNDVFCQISGYTKDELVGRPHNIVRHPDMPSAAFEDLWKTIKSQNIWKGKVKNKSKNGTSYFVNTTVYPIIDMESGDTTEYMSVRFLITDEELEKRNFKKNVMKAIADNKRQNVVARNKITDLEIKLQKMSIFEENLRKEQEKNKKLVSQNSCYEDEIRQLKLDFYDNSKALREESNKFYQDFLTEKKLVKLI